ncbi:MAG: homocysteine S-methyltransferase family protein [Eubacteriales bacterium]|nr:homocysteine S-methyltransferase family protein [Eubacteriales bacterium]
MFRLDNFRRPVILDGATGTRLQVLGLPAGVCASQWILQNPEAMKTVHGSYIRAGSDAVYAPTFGVTRPELERHGVTTGVRDTVLRLVELARDGAPGLAIGGDMSPTGLPLPPLGETEFDELVEIFTEQAAALEEACVDFFVLETQMALWETRAAFQAVRNVSKKPVLVSFATDTGRSLYGGDMGALLLIMQEMGASAFGINCCGDMAIVEQTLQSLRPLARIPLIAKPNAGKPVTENGRAVYRMEPETLAEAGVRFARAGAAFLGGCCGTDDTHIAALRAAVEGIAPTAPAPEPGEYYACEYGYVRYTDQTKVAEIEITDDLEDDADDARYDGAEMISLTMENEEDAELVLESQTALKLPLCVRFADRDLQTRFLREYAGFPKIL